MIAFNVRERQWTNNAAGAVTLPEDRRRRWPGSVAGGWLLILMPLFGSCI